VAQRLASSTHFSSVKEQTCKSYSSVALPQLFFHQSIRNVTWVDVAFLLLVFTFKTVLVDAFVNN
jgi:hypothetical protein